MPILLFFGAIPQAVHAQQIKDGVYRGVENLNRIDPAKTKWRWYRLTYLTIQGADVWVSQSPIAIHKRDTIYSASDGGFYYWKGKIAISKDQFIIDLTLDHCDYCAIPMKGAKGAENWGRKTLYGMILFKDLIIESHSFINIPDKEEYHDW